MLESNLDWIDLKINFRYRMHYQLRNLCKKIEDFMKNWNEKGNQFLDDVTLLAMEFLK